MHKARLRLSDCTMRGELLLDGQRIPFVAQLQDGKFDASFEPDSTKPAAFDVWKAFRALETWVDENLAG